MCLRPGADMICFLPGLLLASQLAAARPRRLCSTQLRKPLNCFAPPCWGVPISPARWPRPLWVRLRTAALIEHLLLSVVCPVPASDPAGRRHSLGGSLARRRLRWRLLRQARALAFCTRLSHSLPWQLAAVPGVFSWLACRLGGQATWPAHVWRCVTAWQTRLLRLNQNSRS